MKEVQVVAWCDGTGHQHQEPATVERRESLSGEPVVLDLCDLCNKSFDVDLDAVRAWLERGVPVSETQPRKRGKSTGPRAGVGGRPKRADMEAPGWRTCPDCGYECPTRTALGQHVKSKHNKVLSNYEFPVSLPVKG